MNIDINLRQNELTRLQNYLKDVDTEVTMILQNLQWDRKHLAENKAMVACQYDTGHRVPPDKLVEHEKGCFLKSQGYTEHDRLLPSPVDPEATTLIKLSGDNIAEIIQNASTCQPSFSVGAGCSGQQPLTVERLQAMYTADERRAIHDAVVSRVPSCHDLSDLALLSSVDESGKASKGSKGSKAKSRLEVLAELRDMRRRRTKYRVAAKTRNYSDVLRDVITTQMDLYTQASNSITQDSNITNNSDRDNNSKAKDSAIEKHTAEHIDNALSRKRQRSTSNMDGHNTPQHSRQHAEHDARTRRHNESDHIDNLTSASSRADYDRDHYSSKSRRRNDEHDARRESHRHHERYDSRNKYREKDYDHKGNCRTAQDHITAPKDKAKDSRYDDSKHEEKYSSKARHSMRVKKEHDKYGNTKLSPKSRDGVDRQKLNECRREQIHSVKIKKERDNCSDDSYSSEDNEIDYTGTTSHDYETYYSMTKIKVEKGDDRGKDYGSKSSDTSDRSTYKDKYYYGKRRDRTNYDDISQRKRTEQEKLKKDGIYEKPKDTNDRRRESLVEDDSWHKKKNERYKRRDDEYRRDKTKEKEIYRRH